MSEPEDGGKVSYFTILREDIQSMRTEFNISLRSLVTADLFRDEQRRVDDKFGGYGREISDLRKALDVEEATRQAAEQTRLKGQIAEQQERERMRRNQTMQWVVLVLSPVAVLVVNELLNK